METKDLAFDDCGQGQVVEELSESLPDVGISVLPQAFVIEAVPTYRD